MLNEQDFFDVLSDETRRRILSLILKEKELCVCELLYALETLQPKVSRHLAVMRESGVLAIRKEGTWVFYRIHPQLPFWAFQILEAMVEAGIRTKPYRGDAKTLALMANRPARCCV